jgi:endonuclease YncB( thermonuclease family)
LPIARPRRIFRSGIVASRNNRRGFSGTFFAGLLCIVGAAGIVAVALPASLLGRVPTLTGTLTADAAHVAVIDGETLRLRETVVRLLGVDAPERGTQCGPGTDCGAAATDALAALVRDRTVVCQLDGRDGAGFPQATCDAGGRSVNHELVATGFARADSASEMFTGDEKIARDGKRGLWSRGAF